MKILLLSEHFFSEWGTAVYTENIARHLAGTGNTVHLIAHAPLDYKKRGKWVNLEDNLYLLVPEIGINQYNTRVSRRALLKSVYKHLFKDNLIQTIKPDIVHVLYGHTIAKILKPLSLKLPTFWTIHNVPPAEYPLPSSSIVYNHFYGGYLSGIKLYHRRLIRNVRPFYYIAISEFIRRKLIKYVGVKPDRIKVVNPGVELKDFFLVDKALARRKVGLTPLSPTAPRAGNPAPISRSYLTPSPSFIGKCAEFYTSGRAAGHGSNSRVGPRSIVRHSQRDPGLSRRSPPFPTSRFLREHPLTLAYSRTLAYIGASCQPN